GGNYRGVRRRQCGEWQHLGAVRRTRTRAAGLRSAASRHHDRMALGTRPRAALAIDGARHARRAFLSDCGLAACRSHRTRRDSLRALAVTSMWRALILIALLSAGQARATGAYSC